MHSQLPTSWSSLREGGVVCAHALLAPDGGGVHVKHFAAAIKAAETILTRGSRYGHYGQCILHRPCGDRRVCVTGGGPHEVFSVSFEIEAQRRRRITRKSRPPPSLYPQKDPCASG